MTRAALAALAVPLMSCGRTASTPITRAADLARGTYLLAFTSGGGGEGETRSVRMWFEVGDNRVLLAVRSEERDPQGRLVQATSYRPGQPQQIRDYRACADDYPTELPSEPLADRLVADAVGPLLPYEAYGFRRVGDMVVGNDGEVRTVLTEHREGVLAGRRLVRYNRDGAVIEVVGNVRLGQAKRAKARVALAACR